MTQGFRRVFKSKTLIITGLALFTATAQAGAPGIEDLSGSDGSVLILAPLQPIKTTPDLTPAEIRNAVSIRMDTLAAQGIEVDRAAVDGIGLNQEDRIAEIEPGR